MGKKIIHVHVTREYIPLLMLKKHKIGKTLIILYAGQHRIGLLFKCL